MKYLGVFILTCLPFLAFTQKYRYRFHGDLTAQQETGIISKIESLQYFQEIKIRYKSDSKTGDLFFIIPQLPVQGETQPDFSPVTIKQILLEAELEPEGAIQLND